MLPTKPITTNAYLHTTSVSKILGHQRYYTTYTYISRLNRGGADASPCAHSLLVVDTWLYIYHPCTSSGRAQPLHLSTINIIILSCVPPVRVLLLPYRHISFTSILRVPHACLLLFQAASQSMMTWTTLNVASTASPTWYVPYICIHT